MEQHICTEIVGHQQLANIANVTLTVILFANKQNALL
jgi:hypothetical protein